MNSHLSISAVKQKPAGRYGRADGAHWPANGVARPPASLNIRTAIGQVPDPMEPGRNIHVATNRAVDVLEEERARGRISEAAYMTGREVQAVFERAARLGMPTRSWDGGSRVDAAAAHELAIAKNIDAARACDREMDRLEAAVGQIGARFLREIIAEGTSFRAYAERRGWAGDRKVAYVGDRFRMALEDLAEFRAARGRA